MKAISVRQPWAWSIIHAGKNIENRTWPTTYRGPILIHAANAMTVKELRTWWQFVELMKLCKPADYVDDRGGIIGSVDLVDCVTAHKSPWFFGPYGFVLANPEPLPFNPCKGRLGIYDTGNT